MLSDVLPSAHQSCLRKVTNKHVDEVAVLQL
jgi:hypothetical protein